MASLPASRAKIEFLGEPRYGEYGHVNNPHPVSATPVVTLTAFPSYPRPAFVTKAGKNNFSTPPRRTASVTRRITLDPFPPGSNLTKLLGFVPPSPKSTGVSSSFTSASPEPTGVSSSFTSASPEPTVRVPGSATEIPRNPIPFSIGQELCFGTDNPRQKRANEDEGSFKTNLIEYIQYVISRFDDDKCPSKELLDPAVAIARAAEEAGVRERSAPLVQRQPQILEEYVEPAVAIARAAEEAGVRDQTVEEVVEPAVAIARAAEEAGVRERSAPLVKRQPQTLDELVELVVNIYNKCPTEGYRVKRAFRVIDAGAYNYRLPYGPHTTHGA